MLFNLSSDSLIKRNKEILRNAKNDVPLQRKSRIYCDIQTSVLVVIHVV